MRVWKLLAVGVAALACAAVTSVSWLRSSRGVRPLSLLGTSQGFTIEESAGVFVGVQQFTREGGTEVQFAVDDAIDLADAFVFDPRVRLIPARNVVLALSGEPVKEESRARLGRLRASGATIATATRDQILKVVRQQADRAGRNGILIVSIATHGFSEDGVPYILGSDSLLTDARSAVSAARIVDIADSAETERAVLFVDACRERVGGSRGAAAERRVAESFIRRLGGVEGLGVFYAAAIGQVAWDDPVARNGVFTRAVINGLRCNAAKQNGIVVARDLATYVDREVTRWVRENRDTKVKSATASALEGNIRSLPLARCGDLPPTTRVEHRGSVVIGYDEGGNERWRTDVRDAVVQTSVADLDNDTRSDVVVAAGANVVVLDDAGEARWRADAGAPVREIAVAQQRHSAIWHVAALSERAISIFDAGGRRVGTRKQDDVIDFAYGRGDLRFTPRIVIATKNGIAVFNPKDFNGPSESAVRLDGAASIDLADGDGDGRKDIAVTTTRGEVLYFDFKCRPLATAARMAR